MDEFFHLLAKVVRAAGERATNCHFCSGFEVGWQQRCRGVIYRARATKIAGYEVFEGAGEMNFAPTNIAHTFEDESYADGKKSVSLADTIFVFAIYPAHLAVYGVTSKSASSRTPHR
jgi:hypothetical protein